MLFAMMNDETSFLGTPSSPRTITKRIPGPKNPQLEDINDPSHCLQILSLVRGYIPQKADWHSP
jgi:hypothetical protein